MVPHAGGQKEVLAATERFQVLRAGRRWGKTKVGARKVLRSAIQSDKPTMNWWIANAQPVYTDTLTPDGWVPMGCLNVGDEVIGSNGEPTRVAGVYHHADRQVWEVELSDGAVIECDRDHLWAFREWYSGNDGPREVVISAGDALEKGLQFGGSRRFSVAGVEVQGDERDLPVPPYMLGLLLGDGSLSGSSVTFANTDADIVDGLHEDLKSMSGRLSDYGNGQYGLVDCPELRDGLQQLGMLGERAATKFVPHEYLHAALQQRLAVLQGLLDSDGSVRKGSGFVYVSISRDLADGVVALVRSLGGRATAVHYEPDGRYIVQGGLPTHNPFRCRRKAERWRPSPRCGRRQVVDIRPTDRVVDMVCIEVEAADHLYVTEHYTLTHNTYKNVRRGYREVVRQCPRELLAKAPPPSTANELALTFKDGSVIEFYSGGNPDALAGEGVDYVVVDEAALIPEHVWFQLVRPALMDKKGEALIISTPRGRNWFWKLWNMGQGGNQGYISWHFTTADNPYISEAEVEEARQTLPDIIFRQENLAEFVDSAASIFDLSHELALVEGIQDPKGHVIFGVDLAKKEDWTVITASRAFDRMPCYHDRFNELSWPVQKDLILGAYEDVLAFPGVTGATMMVDSTGVGDVVFDDLELHGIDVVGIKFTNAWKTSAVQLLAADLERGRAHVLEEQRDEFESYEYEITSSGNFRFEAATGHDDEVAAKLLEHWGIVHEAPPDVHLLNPSELESDEERDPVVPDTVKDLMSRPDVWT